MAEAAQARREARRKRILENSHNRLQIISNITNDECCNASPIKSVKTPITPILRQNFDEIPAATEIPRNREPINNGIINTEPISHGTLPDNNDEFLFGEGEITNDLAAFASPKPEPSQLSLIDKLLRHKYDLVIVSVMVQLLYSFSFVTSDNTYFFLPPILYSFTKAMFMSSTQETSNLASLLLLVNGMSVQRAHKILTLLHWTSLIFQNLCIYLFVTVCIQSLIRVTTYNDLSS